MRKVLAAFRGANINNILNFQKDYEGETPSVWEQNRLTKKILWKRANNGHR
jgi:superfamily I DNA/RNA helicase